MSALATAANDFAIASDLVFDATSREINEFLPPALHRLLGYFGSASRVLFFFDRKAGDVVWEDGRERGVSRGGWQAFQDVVEPLARRYQVGVGSHSSPASFALVLDRNNFTSAFQTLAQARSSLRGRRLPSARSRAF